ncbi:MAG: hypothetical protein HY079_14980 [Elusimicrobia bacterium]|nr:hypothetical protein [Elusimicrobiota bacterium]
MNIKSRAMRTMAALISLALVHASFGPAAWAAAVNTAVSGSVGDAGSSAGASVNSAAAVAAVPTSAVMPLTSAPSLVAFAAPSAYVSPIAAAMPASALTAGAAYRGAAQPAAAVPTALPGASLHAPAAPSLHAAPAASTPESASAKTAPAAPALSEVSAASIESGPRTKSAGSRISRRFAELKAYFGGKSAQTTPAESEAAVPAALTGVDTNEPTLSAHTNALAASPKDGDKVAQSGGDNAPPAPAPQTPGDDGKDGKKSNKGALFGLGLAGFSIIGYMLAMQVGLEAQGVAMPQLTENAFKDFTLLPLVTVFASIGSMIGQPMAKFFIDHLGMSKTFYAAHILRALSLGTMVVLFGTGMMSMPLMMGFYLLNGIVTGVASTAEGTLRKLILAEKGVSMQSFRTWWQLLAETLAVPAPIFFGALVHTLGAVGAPIVTAVYPVTILLGLMLAYFLKIYPLKDVKKAAAAADAANAAASAAATPNAPAPAKKGVWAGIKAAAGKIFSNMEAGKNYVMSVPYLKYSLTAAAVFDLFNVIIYRLIAPGYGKMTGGAAGLSAVQGNLVGMFSLGGLLLSVVFLALESRAKAKAKNAPQTPEAAAAAERSSMLRWMFAGVPALALLGLMAFHMALPLAPLIIGGTNYMPASVFAAALIPFGFFQVAASIKLNSYFQEKLPQDPDKVQKALAFSGSVMTALSIVTMLAMRPLFSAVDLFNPFPWVAGALIPIAAALIWMHRLLAKSTTPEAVAAADAHQGDAAPSKNAGAYVGLILGIVAAAVVITALPMIPGVAGLIASLGVLGKFALNLALTVAFPVAGALIGRGKAAPKTSK